MDPWDKLLSCVHVPKMYENYWTTMILSRHFHYKQPNFWVEPIGIAQNEAQSCYKSGARPVKNRVIYKKYLNGRQFVLFLLDYDNSLLDVWKTVRSCENCLSLVLFNESSVCFTR